MTNHILKLGNQQIRFTLSPMPKKPGASVVTDYEVNAPGVSPFIVKFPNHLQDAKAFLADVYQKWGVRL